MVRIADIHPTVAHSMETTIKILESAIALRQREIENYRSAIDACHKVKADEMLPRGGIEAQLESDLQHAVDNEYTPSNRLSVAMQRVDGSK